jgi:hypothetical protein
LRDRQEEIRSKGFSIVDRRQSYEGPIDYGKMKIGTKTLDDAVLDLGAIKKASRNNISKAVVLDALYKNDIPKLREISDYFYKTSGIYSRVCNYFAFLYRYDWYVIPEIHDESVKEEKVLKDYDKVLAYLDNTHIKKLCGDIALEVIKHGAYYGYLVEGGDGAILQQLPINYCRSRFFVGNVPAIEFNMKFFDENFKDVNYRMRVLKMFPPEFAKGYLLFKQGKLPSDDPSDRQGGWYLLEPGNAIKFNLYGNDAPLFANAIPAILDLDAAQELDRKKQMQQLLKIVIQKLPLDKNGDLIFDVDEARDIHNNAVEMLKRAIGVDVLTTFADIDVEDMSDKNTTTTSDDLAKMERTVFNNFGISQNLFNTDGNLSLEKSILADESSIRNLLFQFHMFFDRLAQVKGTQKRKYNFRLYMLETTQYNYRELSKMYKEQVQIGYSKMLPQIAMGHSQSSIIHAAHFENNILHLSEIMVPPMQSSVMNADGLQQLSGKGTKEQSGNSNSQDKSEGSATGKVVKTEEKAAGRPEKSDDQKSEKTIQNKESMS